MRTPRSTMLPLLLIVAIAGCQTAEPDEAAVAYDYDGRNLYLGYWAITRLCI